MKGKGMFVVVVEFEVRAAARERFLSLVCDNAATSRRDEPGCRQFDVCVDPLSPAAVFLYELYDDRAAFDRHLTLPHFRDFDAPAGSLVLSKRVRLLERLPQ
jgi:quinol monooxygenase YgiN